MYCTAHLIFLYLTLSSVSRAVPLSNLAERGISGVESRYLTFALKQQNVDIAEHLLLDISDPDSLRYGEHLTHTEILELFRPTEDCFSNVMAWLVSSGFSKSNIIVGQTSMTILNLTNGAEISSKLGCESSGVSSIGSAQNSRSSCNVPDDLHPYVEYVHLVRISSPVNPIQRRDYLHDKSGTISARSMDSEMLNCTLCSTPRCIRDLYNLPFPTRNISSNNLGIFSSTSAYDQNDMDLFFANMTPYIPQDTHPVLESVDGGVAPVLSMKGHGGEPLLDLSMAYSLIYPQQITLFQVDDPLYSTSPEYPSLGFDDFLSGIDGSYCNFAGGNDPRYDPTYPDNRPGGYNGTLQCGVYKPTNVISISYGTGETAYPVEYERRICLEFLKLGLQGVSILFGSGDTGVSNHGNCSDGPDGPGTRFQQHFPASCPWVTAVGGTMTVPGTVVRGVYDEVAAEVDFSAGKNFSSGGGFSDVFKRPKYQDQAVKKYLTYHNPGYSPGRYNASGRAYPDVSANSVNFYIWDNGTFIPNDGTSASTPLWASVVTLINQERILVNKTPVGFINPVLYKHPEVLRDITSGRNANCKSNGFAAVTGWDPVTGLGTPQWDKLKALFLSLP